MAWRKARTVAQAQRGFSLLEAAIALAVTSIIVVLLAQTLDISIVESDRVRDRSTIVSLAQSQMEDVMRQPYNDVPAAYPTITPPQGYTITITAAPVVTYTYPAPVSTDTQETIQKITVTVSGVYGSLDLEGYKVR